MATIDASLLVVVPRGLGRLAVAALVGLSAAGCDDEIPTSIAEPTIAYAVERMPATASAMCGVPASGLLGARVTVTARGELHRGLAHVEGTLAGAPPRQCTGDVMFAFAYREHTVLSSRSSKTKWFLESLTVIAVQTPEVHLASVMPESPSEQVIVTEDGTLSREPLLRLPAPPPQVIQRTFGSGGLQVVQSPGR
jgi:hypothetical protein